MPAEESVACHDVPAAKKAKLEPSEEEERVFCAAQLLSGALDDNLEHPEQDRGRAVLQLFDNSNSNDSSSSSSSLSSSSSWTFHVTRAILHGMNSHNDKHPSNNNNNNNNNSDDDDDDDENASLINALGNLLIVKTVNTDTVLWKMLQDPLLSVALVLDANLILQKALTCSTTTFGATSDKKTYYQRAHGRLMQALSLWPCNPSALVVLANLVRMGYGHETTTQSINPMEQLAMALDLYLAAAKAAHALVQACRAFLSSNQPTNDDKFLVETLLGEAAQMDYKDDDDDDDDDDEHDEQENAAAPCQEETSKVLVTASLMSATLASATGKHDIAAQVLRRFGPNMTRIHPNVWKAAVRIQQQQQQQQTETTATSSQGSSCCQLMHGAFVPRVFPNTVPDGLFDVLRHAFRPNAPYWQQSGYDRNVYYSFWTDWPLPHPANEDGCTKTTDSSKYVVSNAVEHYIVTCLLPRVRSICPQLEETLCGYEWWFHTRPHGTNLGHQLHFDTDEALLEQDKIVEFPISASVTYLNEENDTAPYGATILFDQTPYVKENANTAWICAPKSRNFMLFPGDLLHGVLPCTDNTNHDDDKAADDDGGQEHHRLTFMVNFWSYRIPDRLKQRKLYGPSGPFPPRTNEHSWVEDICQSYPQTVSLPTGAIEPANDGLVAASPAWDSLGDSKMQTRKEEEDDHVWAAFDCETILPLPPSGGINQRFFVTNAPEFFKATLFEK